MVDFDVIYPKPSVSTNTYIEVIISMIKVIIVVMIVMQNNAKSKHFRQNHPFQVRVLMLLTMIMCLHTFVPLFDKCPLASVWDWGLLDDSQRLSTYLQQYDVINQKYEKSYKHLYIFHLVLNSATL